MTCRGRDIVVRHDCLATLMNQPKDGGLDALAHYAGTAFSDDA